MNFLPKITTATRVTLGLSGLMLFIFIIKSVKQGYIGTRMGIIYRSRDSEAFHARLTFEALYATMSLLMAVAAPKKRKLSPDVPANAAHRKKNAAHLGLVPVAFVIDAVLCYALVMGICRLGGEFRNDVTTFSSYSQQAQTPIVIAVLLSTLPVGFLATNLIIWIIPPLRIWFEGEAHQRNGLNFGESSRGLLNITKFWTPAFLGAALAAAIFVR